MPRTFLVILSSICITAATGLAAHEGHKHAEEKVAGTVVQVHKAEAVTHIEIKTTKGETIVLSADSATRYLKDKNEATLADVKPGLRIVATVVKDGEVSKASEITLGVMDPDAAHGSDHKH